MIAGTPVPPAFHPAFVAPATAAATLNADGIAVAFPAAAADPASILTGYVVTLRDGAGATLLSQVLPPTAISAAFPTLQPGVFSVTVVATYSEGASAPVLSAPVTLAPPTNTVRPALAGPGIVGTRLSCAKGTWSWPGTSTLSTEWLRGKKPIGVTGASYRLVEADAGKPITCAVTLRAATGPTARAESAPVVAELELQKTRSPRVRGSAVVGATLTCSTGTWKHTGLLVFSYRWLRDGKLTGKPSQRTLIVAAIDAGHRIACRVTAVAGKQKESAVSAGVLAAAA